VEGGNISVAVVHKADRKILGAMNVVGYIVHGAMGTIGGNQAEESYNAKGSREENGEHC
jgi:hypothetical protein